MVEFSATLGGAARGLGWRTMRGRGEHQMYRWAFTAAAVAVFTFVAILTAELPDDFKTAASEKGLVIAGIAGVLAMAYRVRHSSGRRRRAWTLLGVGMGLALVTNTYFGPMEPTDPVKPVGDTLILLGLCVGAFGFLSFPSRARRGTEAARMLLDGIVVGGSILYIVAVAVFPELIPSDGNLSYRDLILMLIPVADGVLATLAVLLILRSNKGDRPALGLLSGGIIMYAVADLIYAVESAKSPWSFGSLYDIWWIAGYAFITLAALHPANRVHPLEERRSEPSSILGTLLVFGLFFVAAVLTIGLNGANTGTRLVSIVMWVAVLLAVASRQILYVVDNRALRQSLEQRVQERTAELSKLTEQSELLLSSVGEGIYGVDRHGLVTFANPAAAHILGCRPEDLIGLPAHDGWHDLQDDGTPYPVEDCYVTDAIRSGVRTHVAEDVYRRRDGTTVPVEVTASPLSSADGIQGAVVVFRDTTQRREVDRMKSEFVSVVSHELRTPLTAIRGSLGLLAGGALGELPSRAGRMVTIALESSERLTRLINDILDLERIEAGTTPMDLADHSVAELIEGGVEQMSVIAANADVTLRVLAAEGTVRANADRIAQTLLNLIGNAIKFSPPGTTVSIGASGERNGDEIEFRVSDHGRGIPVDKIESIFKRFDQVDSSDAREKGGTGLGLAICKSIVERHGGRIWAESEPGRGSTFRFTLPRAAARSHRPTVSTAAPTVAVHGVDQPSTEALCRSLEARGYRTTPLRAVESAASLFESQPPDAVVLDVGQTKSNAYRLISELRSNPATRDVALVVVSRWHPEDLPMIAAHANGWVLSPEDGEHLARTVTVAILGRRALGDLLVVEDRHDLAATLPAKLESRGLTVSQPRTQRGALVESATARPHVLILDSDLPHPDAVALSAELRDGGLLADVPVVVYVAHKAVPDTGDDLRLGRTLFLDRDRSTVTAVDERIAELVGMLTHDRGR